MKRIVYANTSNAPCSAQNAYLWLQEYVTDTRVFVKYPVGMQIIHFLSVT